MGWDLAARPHEYHFFQLVRLLEQRLQDQHPEYEPLGQGKEARREGVRLRPSLDLGFPAADVAGAELYEEAGRAEVETTFLGLYGVNSPLPRWYTQQLLWDAEEVPQQRAFLDIFHHRVLSLLYRVWRQHRYEHAYAPGAQDRLSRALLDLVALRPEDTAADLGLEPARALRYLGLLQLRQRPAEGLRALLEEELGLHGLLRIEPFPVRWVNLEWEDLYRLGSLGGQLGRDVFVGRRRLDRMGLLELHVGPVTQGVVAAEAGPRLLRYEEAERLMPGGADHGRLLRLLRLYLRRPLDLRLVAHVPLPGVPMMRLSRGARLGAMSLCRSASYTGAELPSAHLRAAPPPPPCSDRSSPTSTGTEFTDWAAELRAGGATAQRYDESAGTSSDQVSVKIVRFQCEVPMPMSMPMSMEDETSHVPA